jgi:ubiquinone/menaquinone biosynthesis C-methylase UbiE
MERKLQCKSAKITRRSFGNFLIPDRVDQPELLDLGVGSPHDVAENLAQMQHINDWFGGTQALFFHLLPRLAGHTGVVTLLDLGTGMAGIPAALLRWSRRKGLDLRIYALDHAMRNLQTAQQVPPGMCLIQADARDLPISPGQVDYVISSLFMHHLSPPNVIQVLHDSYRLARCGVIMSDLVRGWLPWAAFHLIQPVFGRSYLTRRDGLLSILRAYTAQELLSLAQASFAVEKNRETSSVCPMVYQHWPWRMTLVVDK